MLDILSDTNWLNWQIDFLVFLQNIRVANSEIFSQFFSSITIFGEIWLPTLICAIMYWCIDERKGLYLFSLFCGNVFTVHLLKLLACVYRPWVLSEQIQPFGNATEMAKSYSFPSGHSGMASSVVGGVAYLLRNHKILTFGLTILILLIGFSRLWLGVHTPQDVIVGLGIGFLLIFVIAEVHKWADADKNRYLYILAFVNTFAILALIYLRYFKSYPMDYVNGELLVNPNASIRVTLAYYAYALGLINGGYLCRRYFPFDAKNGSMVSKIFRGICGALCVYLVMKSCVSDAISLKYHSKPVFCGAFIMGFFITAIYPIIFAHIPSLLGYVKFDKGKQA